MYQYKDLYVLDFSKIKYYSELHEIIKVGLDFPDYYGKNWDAFWDCLTDMVGRPVHIEIRGLEQLEKKFKEDAELMLELLKEWKHYNKNSYAEQITIDIILEGKTVSLP